MTHTMKVAARDKETKEVIVVEMDCYETRKDFRDDINRNGYTVIGSVMVDGVDPEDQKHSALWKKHHREDSE